MTLAVETKLGPYEIQSPLPRTGLRLGHGETLPYLTDYGRFADYPGVIEWWLGLNVWQASS
jgi:hypothetical protein